MLLQPRKFKYKNKQKLRKAVHARTYTQLYGGVALVILQPVYFSAKRIFRFKLFLKRAARKSDITRRAFWVSLFPHLPLTKKTKGQRMGKGKGKLSTWFTYLHAGRALIEFKNLRLGRAIYYSKQAGHKLEVEYTISHIPSRHIKVVGASQTNPQLLRYW